MPREKVVGIRGLGTRLRGSLLTGRGKPDNLTLDVTAPNEVVMILGVEPFRAGTRRRRGRQGPIAFPVTPPPPRRLARKTWNESEEHNPCCVGCLSDLR